MGKSRRNSKKLSSQKTKELTSTPESAEALNSKVVSETLVECIHTGDLDAFRSVLASHIMSTNKFRLAQETGIARRTLYDILDPKMNFDPALSTLSAIIRGLAKC